MGPSKGRTFRGGVRRRIVDGEFAHEDPEGGDENTGDFKSKRELEGSLGADFNKFRVRRGDQPLCHWINLDGDVSVWLPSHQKGDIVNVGITYNYLGYLQVYCHLGDCPHACSRVEKKTVPVDSMKHPHNGHSVPYSAVVWDPAERRKIRGMFFVLRVHVNDTRDNLWFPLGSIHGACTVACERLI